MSRKVKESMVLLVGAFLLVASIWGIQWLFYPILGMSMAGLVYLSIKKKFVVDFFDLTLFVLLGYELINYGCSLYKPNSWLALENFFLVGSVVCVLKRLLTWRYSWILYVTISCVAFLLCLINSSNFFFRFFQASYYGFDDFSQFRHLYLPWGLLSNEWVTVVLSLIPFVLLALLSVENQPISRREGFFGRTGIRIFFLLTFVSLLFNLFTSFSRGGYIAFAALWLSMNCLFFRTKTLPTRTLLVGNVLLVVFLSLLAIGFDTTLRSTVLSTSASHTRSLTGRLEQWNAAADLPEEHLWTGIGSKNYPLVAKSHESYRADYMFTGRVNNTFIQVIVEKGLIGSILYLAVLIVFTVSSLKTIFRNKGDDRTMAIIVFSAVFSILVRELTFSSLFYNPGLLVVFLLLLAIGMRNNGPAIKLNHRRAIPFALFYTVILICCTYSKLEYDRKLSEYQAIVDYLDNKEFAEADRLAERFDVLKSGDATYFSIKGIVQERILHEGWSIDSLLTPGADTDSRLSKAQEYYSRSIELNPSDDLSYHNLGWIHFFKGEYDRALKDISRAIEINANSAIYYVSRGLILENNNKEDESFEDFKRAVVLSPDIMDSRFFEDLKLRHNDGCTDLLNEVTEELYRFQENRYSPVIQAKIGKMELDREEVKKAGEIFTGVVKELPNLNRAWYYLGLISEIDKEYENMLEFYNKSLFLDMRDFLPRQQLALYYQNAADTIKYNYYRKTAEKYHSERSSEHSNQFERVYYQRTIRNDIIPSGLLLYITPELELKTKEE